jgi:sulfate transport system substrate-binding protein
MNRRQFLTATSAAALAGLSGCGDRYDVELLNVSYDPTRELYRKINRLFAADYLQKTGLRVRVRQSHGGSGSQARAVMDGLPADVATLALWPDTDAIRRTGLIDDGWETRLPNQSLPYSSTVVFVVRRGNPHGVRDWPDLLKPGVRVIPANPKTSGGAKLALLGAWGAVRLRGGSEADARGFITELYRRVPVLDSGARGATVTFARKGIGDVHLTWENEARLEERELKGEVEIVYPPLSVRAEPHVAVVDANARHKGTADAARAYLEFLYTPAAQELIAATHYRPADPDLLARHADRLQPVELFRVTDPRLGLGNWDRVQRDFFAEGGLFDQVYQPGA